MTRFRGGVLFSFLFVYLFAIKERGYGRAVRTIILVICRNKTKFINCLEIQDIINGFLVGLLALFLVLLLFFFVCPFVCA